MNKTDKEKLKEFTEDLKHLEERYQDVFNYLKQKNPDYASGNFAIGFVAGKRSAYSLLIEEFYKRGLA